MNFWAGFEKRAGAISQTFRRLHASPIERQQMAKRVRESRKMLEHFTPGTVTNLYGHAGGREVAVEQMHRGLPVRLKVTGEKTVWPHDTYLESHHKQAGKVGNILHELGIPKHSPERKQLAHHLRLMRHLDKFPGNPYEKTRLPVGKHQVDVHYSNRKLRSASLAKE